MHIVINRTKEDSQSITRLRKNIAGKVPQRKIFLCIIIGFVFFFYSGDGINFSSFSGYILAAMFFWGGAAILYLEKMYPKITSSPIATIRQYKKSQTIEFNYKIELTESYFSFDSDETYVKISWNVVNGFKLHKEYIFLLREKDDSIPLFVIKQSELTEYQYNELYEFLKEETSTKSVQLPI